MGLFITTFANFLSTHLFVDVISVHNGYMKHARVIEFDYTNFPAMLKTLLPASILLQYNFLCYRGAARNDFVRKYPISLFERDITTRGFSPRIMVASLFSHEQLIRIIEQQQFEDKLKTWKMKEDGCRKTTTNREAKKRSGTKNSWSGNNNIV